MLNDKSKMMASAVLCGLLATPPVFGADIAGGKRKASSCVACHGVNGISTNASYPNLAGQKSPYLAKQLRDFKSGARKDPTMQAMVGGLSDADIDNIAAYFASLGAK